jgi:hypothetical protein
MRVFVVVLLSSLATTCNAFTNPKPGLRILGGRSGGGYVPAESATAMLRQYGILYSFGFGVKRLLLFAGRWLRACSCSVF